MKAKIRIFLYSQNGLEKPKDVVEGEKAEGIKPPAATAGPELSP